MTRWKAQKGGTYYFVSFYMEADWEIDNEQEFDIELYNSGNYFKTRREAEDVAAKFRAILDEHHKQNGGQK